jgi:high frequency lysogenization protein
MLQKNKYDNITIALAGIVQAISLVKELAQTGKIDENAFQSCIQSIFATDPENTVLVFGNVDKLKIGLEQLSRFFAPTSPGSPLIIRHMLSILRLQRKMSRSSKILDMLTQRIHQAKKQTEYFSMTHPNVLANLGDIYLNLITHFRFRFFILGNKRFLDVRENIDKIRALLLAAVRAAVLWKQNGGSRLQFVFSSKKIKSSIEKIRNSYVTS